ncbi:MAG: lysine--tRNA ligase [bacterium]
MKELELKAWPYKEAEKIVEKMEREGARKHDYVLFESGFGPSGLPHIGTFAEVARSTWVRHAFENMTGKPTKLFAFSDDMDGLRAVPDNIPNAQMLLPHLGKPLCEIPDPFGEEDSFSGYMNAKLRGFLDRFGFEYDFKSSKDQYRGGVFNPGLLKILENYEAVRGVILPTLGQKRDGDNDRSAWSPFMPVCPSCGKVYTTRVTDTHPESGEISYACDQGFDYKGNHVDACGHGGRLPVIDGNVKVGWKVDWALRWYVFGVDYEMYGKDLIESAALSTKIVKLLGGEPPVGMFYEMFLDENGEKISKSRGNGLEVEEWLKYGPLDSLSWFIYQNPIKARKLYFDVIPKSVDDYLGDRERFGNEDEAERVNNPVFFIAQPDVRAGNKVEYTSGISYSMLLNLVSVLNTDDHDIIWNYVRRYAPDAEKDAVVDSMIDRAITYYRDFVAPTKNYVDPPDDALPALRQLVAFLKSYTGNSAEELQNATYAAGKENDLKLGHWFACMYRMLLGQERGPRLGTFIQLYGVSETLELIESKVGDRL